MRQHPIRRIDPALIGIALISAFLNLFNIWKDQYANAYYTSAVASMLQSFHTFFYASFDPAGYVTVDKPPVTFWIQTVSAYLFGLHGWSVILPQALAGIGSVLLVYALVKPSFGRSAARLASLIFACTPIAAAVSRTNNVDSLLVFTLLLGTWMLFRAVRRESWFWAVGAFGVIGIGFNEKMLQAYMVVPAFVALYLLAYKAEWKKKLTVLAGATAVMVMLSLSWALIVDTVSPDSRPYIGSSQTNSVIELALGYNGVSRLTGNRGQDARAREPFQGGGPMQDRHMSDGRSAAQSGSAGPGPGFMPGGDGNPQRPPGMNGEGPFGQKSGGMFNTGQPGPLRLFQTELSGQISWLLPFAAFGTVGLLAGIRRRKRLTEREQETLFWLSWLLPAMAFFSVAGFFHQYYLIMLAAPIAALSGSGWVALWQFYRRREGWKRWLLPAGLLATTAFELVVLQPYSSQIGIGWLAGIGAAGAVASLLLFLYGMREKLASIAAVAGILVLLAAPLYWAATPLLYGGNSTLPEAGPQLNRSGSEHGMPRMGMTESRTDAKLLDYVTKNNTGEKYLFATTSATSAAPYIIQTGKAVMAMGGFSGSDPILTVSKLQKLVDDKEVKYFLIPSGSGFGFGFGGGMGGSTEVMSWIREHGKEIAKEQWQSGTNEAAESPMGKGPGGAMALYEIQS
ncbi:ArnT family glycosyltransferase [Paenibacillus elgii]|uniref:ArnT family glycosyltransferase n=1 Tax=Paenibacillus elgii TaxID=189691 RepID=UPI000FD89333|nr:glycosyltransferase family 39 protein [Paenibacillus elgii]NEN86218.1 glycosyltransferase family 39 protein [Paenibacillus elgii]